MRELTATSTVWRRFRPSPVEFCATARRECRLAALASRAVRPASIRPVLGAARCRRRPRSHDHAGAGRHRLCRGVRRAGHLRSLCDDRAAARLCSVRSEPDPGAGAGLLARARDPGRSAPALGRRCGARGRDRRHHGDRLGRDLRRIRPRAARLHHRAALQAHSLRIHERDRADGAAQPDPQALRLLRRGDGAAASGRASSRRCWRNARTPWRSPSARARSR